MSKFIGIAIGAAEIATGALLEIFTFGASTPLTMFLISSGAGMLISGIGTLLSGTVHGTSTGTRNPIAPWNVVYGRAKVGGTLVYFNEFGDNNKYLDMVFVLACHPSKSFDALLLDGQRIRLDSNGCSFTPTQQTVSIVSISRTNDVVTVQTASAITDLQTADSIQIKNVSGSLDSDKTFNGIFPVTVIDATHFSYINGGLARTLTGTGQATTLWPNYKAKIHAEWLLGNHTATFPGMLNGTPYDGDPGNLVTFGSNPWSDAHKLLGRTSVFLRLHYNDTIFANGLPTISFRISGKNDIYDPRASAVSNILQRPTTLLNGWGGNAHVGAYEEGVDQGYNFGLDSGTTRGYQNPGSAVDGDLTTNASAVILHNHTYAGCVWQFASLPASPVPGTLYLNILSAVNPFSFTGRSAGIWYSLNNGTSWTQVYNTPDHPQAWDSIPLSPTTDTSQLQVMAFTDAHDDMGHYVYDVQLSTGPGTSNANGTGYTENAALCTADYLCQPTWGFKARYGIDVPLDRLIVAANICDELVPIAAGGTEPRYACNGGFPLSLKRGEVLQNLLTSCGGRITYQNGQFIIWPAAWMGIGFPTPPFPPGPGQSVAWAVPAAAGPGQLTFGHGGTGLFDLCTGSASSNPASKGGAASGAAGYTVSRGLGQTDNGLVFGQFRVDGGLPANAVISAIYPVVIVGYTHDVSSGCFVEYGTGMHTDSRVAVTSTNFPGAPLTTSFFGQLTGASIGTDLALLDAINIRVQLTTSLFGDHVVDQVGAGNPAMAVYYHTPDGNPVGPFPGASEILAIASGPFRWREKVAIRDLYNGVKGTYISPANNWQASDIPAYAQDSKHGYMSGSPLYPFGDANLAADGGDRRWLDIQLPFTISCPCAQRLCKVELMRRRQQGTGTFLFNLAMYKTTVMDVVQMTLSILGWTNKLLEISAHRFTLAKENQNGTEVVRLGTEIDVQETDPSVYEWSTSEELTAEGFQGNSSGDVSTPGGISTTYTNNPPYSLSQPSSTEIDLQAVTVTFTNGNIANYHARSITITAITAPTWLYVYVIDPDLLGDIAGTSLVANADQATTNVGIGGFVYMGAILALPAGGASRVLPGGWPAPSSFQVGP